ncbi:uncharacterized protein BDW47DRAFT_76123 [Aspergillus candidus]|uniref:Gryzun, putative trafficking through golgi-domain-containing protein n=1 Tax=Aspergillus candidus TaxID=41067 RepID=A0A2I2F1U9_ASPCN|nr:Gryzun, putative trafficking through golgi-domain-containing protein [Aspergillus candidus]PLB34599.1 Gryzun, putative trafficking through golgi-domain-containing protein [Aspergillus candidus]
MDAYPEDYVVHNLPFILLSGLDAGSDGDQHSDYPLLHRGDPTIDSDFPPLTGPTAEQLRQAFLEEDASRAPWERRNEKRAPSTGVGYKIKSVGRSYRLPPRKADPPPASPPTSPNASPDNGGGHGPHFVLHSPISPLTPSSPTFPDGLLTPLWVTKHQGLVPAVVINFFPFCQDPNMNSLRDNQLKIEINGLKKQWSSSGYKTRFLVVLLSEENSGAVVEEAEERIASIRRATNLDQKSIFLLPADATPTELKEFVTSLESLLHPVVMDYYRDLSKHARRKRNRSAIPPPTAPPTSGTSQTLSLQGWNVRYEFKLGVFAEFRQETDAALRNYESAYETLFGQEVFENIPGWSPRFNDARLLADSLAVRIIRCLLRCGQPAAAVRSWNNHRRYSQGVINRRGKGTNNYGWEAWEARWSMVMAQLIHQAEISYFRLGPSQDQSSEQYSIYVPREKAQPQHGIISPWEHLHHEGYWLCRSAKHTMYRRELAEKIPVEDRIPPGQSPASQIASKSYLYDTYLVPETHIEAPQAGVTGFDHSPLILDALKAALEEFSKRGQVRKTEMISLEIAEEYMRAGSWVEAYDILRPLWPTLTWRRSGWWQLMEKFGWALRECAFRVHDSGMILQVDWELLNRAFHEKPDWQYDIHKSLGDLPPVKPKPSIVLNANDVIPSVTASFVFSKSEGNVGEPLQGQLTITSHTQASSKPIRFSEVKVVFEGCLRPIKLQSDQNTEADTATPCTISSPTLRDSSTTHDGPLQSPTSWLTPLVGMADLSIGPSQTKVFDLRCIPREAGECSVASVTLSIEEDKFDLACAITDLALSESYWWQQTSKGPSRRRVGQDREINRCKVNPKPPKIRITTPNLKTTYYTNERVVLKIGIHNEEDEAANVQAEARLFGPPESAAKITWLDEEPSSESEDSEKRTLSDSLSHLVQRSIGVMERSTQRELAVVLGDTDDASDHELEISAVYNLVSDVQTPVIATTRVKLSIIRPFEANYDFLPRIHPQPWPDFFTASEDPKSGSDPAGLQQRWCLNSKVVSFALEPLVIEKMTLVLLGVGGGAVCDVGPEALVSPEASEIQPEELRESNFQMDLHKTILGDRRATAVSLQLEIQWRRSETSGTGDAADSSDDQVTATSTLAVPRFVVPVGEPRVLASSIASKNLPGLIHLDYTLENPSMHFLTFNLAMEANENFAFSGPKTVVVQLVPLSRHTVRYNLLASKRGLWIQPQLLVMDTYFNKTLRVLPTEDMQSDKKGPMVWVDADD